MFGGHFYGGEFARTLATMRIEGFPGTMPPSGESSRQTAPATTPACFSTSRTHATSEQHLRGSVLNQQHGDSSAAQPSVAADPDWLLHYEADGISRSSSRDSTIDSLGTGSSYNSTDDLRYFMRNLPGDDEDTPEVVADIANINERRLLRLTFLKRLVETALTAGMNMMKGGALPHCEVFYTGAIRALLGDKSLLPYLPANHVHALRASLYEATMMRGDVFDRISTLHRALGTIAAIELPNSLVDLGKQRVPQISSGISPSGVWESPTVDANVDAVDAHGGQSSTQVSNETVLPQISSGISPSGTWESLAVDSYVDAVDAHGGQRSTGKQRVVPQISSGISPSGTWESLAVDANVDAVDAHGGQSSTKGFTLSWERA